MRPVFRVKVTGISMTPTLLPGEQILCTGLLRRLLIRRGVIIVARDPRDSTLLIIKRVERVDNKTEIWVLGDNQTASSDSRQFGYIPLKRVEGRALFIYSPKLQRL